MAENLPFGETDVSKEEIHRQVEYQAAVDNLANAGVSEPEKRLDVFFNCVPDLLTWLERNGREFPWRFTRDPWRVYISEILLQRTRSQAVANLYEEFFGRYPDAESLVRADDDAIFDIIETLGFGNHRTRTLSEVAEIVHEDHGGLVPDDLDELQRPFRVGPYSARACLVFAYGEPLALVDSNFARVIGRVFDYEMPAQPHKSDEVYSLLTALVPRDGHIARAFNLSILDLGALVCTSENPACDRCPLEPGCMYASKRNYG